MYCQLRAVLCLQPQLLGGATAVPGPHKAHPESPGMGNLPASACPRGFSIPCWYSYPCPHLVHCLFNSSNVLCFPMRPEWSCVHFTINENKLSFSVNCSIRNVPLQLEAFSKGYTCCQPIEDTSTASGLIVWTIRVRMWVNMALDSRFCFLHIQRHCMCRFL